MSYVFLNSTQTNSIQKYLRAISMTTETERENLVLIYYSGLVVCGWRGKMKPHYECFLKQV